MRYSRIISPNNLTIVRLGFSFFFFWLLTRCRVGEGSYIFDLSVVVFILTGLTDIVDGYIARRFGMETRFGRLFDPFVDKVLICGAFLFFLGPNFVIDGKNITGLQPWMVVLVISRELLVTSLRGASEAIGRRFPATLQGKLKMFIQSATVVAILIGLGHHYGKDWARLTMDIFIWVMLIFTMLSMTGYLVRYFKEDRA